MISRKFKPFGKYPFLVTTLNTLFYITWIPFRLCVFPVATLMASQIAYNEYQNDGKVSIAVGLGLFAVVVMTALYIKWTYDLILVKLLDSGKKRL